MFYGQGEFAPDVPTCGGREAAIIPPHPTLTIRRKWTKATSQSPRPPNGNPQGPHRSGGVIGASPMPPRGAALMGYTPRNRTNGGHENASKCD
jgi:hypothetical protein